MVEDKQREAVRTVPRPGMLTRSRANRLVRTPGGRLALHRKKFYRAVSTCALTGTRMQLPKNAKQGRNRRASRSSKRPNRPYGGVASPSAARREIVRVARRLNP